MWWKCSAVLVLALVGLAAPLPASASSGTSGQAGLRAEIQQLVDVDGVPGVTAVTRQDGVTERMAAGLADIPERRAMQPDSQFRVASLTKTFVATVVLQLVAEHHLALDQPIAGLLPEPIPNADTITVRELLDHSSGLFDYSFTPGFDATAVYTPAQLIAIAVQQPPYFTPGTGFHYSSTNYIALGEIVSNLTGRSIQHEVQARLIDGLHLTNTTFPTETTVAPRQARGYEFTAPLPPRTGPALDVTTHGSTSASAAGAAAAMVSNGDDLDRFLDALLGGRLLPQALLTEMKSPTPGAEAFFANDEGIPGFTYGLGMIIDSTPCGPAYGHVGIIEGYFSVAMQLGGREISLLLNTDSLQLSLLRQTLSIAQGALCPQ